MTNAITIHDQQSGARASIAPDLGFNCFQFQVDLNGETVQVIDSPEDVLTNPPRPSSFGIPVLFPFPNRIRAGQFQWEGKDYHVPLSPGHPNAIHGFCYDRPWRVVEQSEDSVTGQFQLSIDDPQRAACWPADFILSIRYRVAENRLETQFRIENPSPTALPWGLGTHAYFRLPLSANSQPEDCTFGVDVHEEWELEESLPTGRRLPLESSADRPRAVTFGTRTFDNVYTGWETDGETVRTSVVDEKGGLEINQVCDGRVFREAVIFTPANRNAVCLEPYSCVTDAMNLHHQDLNTGLQILDPGEQFQTWLAIQVSPIYA
ncbi:Aldose 1-epimerase [Thalassoglobus neptunius]|uniref:Aldose 1-epimerase n=1 Tax=Thalassoglobus neptunius TaxID=1938619 RepID=A0A5C5X5J0_9PLAN|nr:aldose 1-epimerase [Thalassoglobus neptunius]TWT57591.1 Aldose 1-epimerase [Thalassoglobus neptunius]